LASFLAAIQYSEKRLIATEQPTFLQQYTHILRSLKKSIVRLYLFICSPNSFFQPFANSQDLNKLSEGCLDLPDVYMMQFLYF